MKQQKTNEDILKEFTILWGKYPKETFGELIRWIESFIPHPASDIIDKSNPDWVEAMEFGYVMLNKPELNECDNNTIYNAIKEAQALSDNNVW